MLTQFNAIKGNKQNTNSSMAKSNLFPLKKYLMISWKEIIHEKKMSHICWPKPAAHNFKFLVLKLMSNNT